MKKKKVELREFARTSPQTLERAIAQGRLPVRAQQAWAACTAGMDSVYGRASVLNHVCMQGNLYRRTPASKPLLLILHQRFTDVNRWNGWTADAPSALYELNEKHSC